MRPRYYRLLLPNANEKQIVHVKRFDFRVGVDFCVEGLATSSPSEKNCIQIRMIQCRY